MSKYRLLTFEELESLEKEFVEYLILNGITADDWQKMKETKPEKAETIIQLFSEVVFEGIMRKVQFLEYRDKNEVMAFQCLPEKMVLVGIQNIEGTDFDFTKIKNINEAASFPQNKFKIYTKEKTYHKKREIELFEMTNNGCTISDGTVFKALCLGLS